MPSIKPKLHNRPVDEIWRKLVFNTNVIADYVISNYGVVYNWKRKKAYFGWFSMGRKGAFGSRVNVCVAGCTRPIHRLVMMSFKPISRHPPAAISKKDWHITPEIVKKYLAECIIVNHIDHNPKNNHISNLEWVTPGENTRKSIEHFKATGFHGKDVHGK